MVEYGKLDTILDIFGGAMKKVFWAGLMVLFLVLGGVTAVKAKESHRVLLLGDSLTALADWPNYLDYEHAVVAKGGVGPNWVVAELEKMEVSGDIANYDTAVVWIGINDPYQALSGIPEIYRILHSYNIKIVGITQYLPRCNPGRSSQKSTPQFNLIVREQADVVVDFAIDPDFVDETGVVKTEVVVDCVHPNWPIMSEIVARKINLAIEELWFVPPTATPMVTLTATVEPPFPTTTAMPTIEVVQNGETKKVNNFGIYLLVLILVVGLVKIIIPSK